MFEPKRMKIQNAILIGLTIASLCVCVYFRFTDYLLGQTTIDYGILIYIFVNIRMCRRPFDLPLTFHCRSSERVLAHFFCCFFNLLTLTKRKTKKKHTHTEMNMCCSSWFMHANYQNPIKALK